MSLRSRIAKPKSYACELERDAMLAALESSGGKVSGPTGAAARFGLKPSTLTYRMKAIGIGAK